ncbi:hypothetical protein ABTZ92_26655, partial [Streptomyces albidoflavus]
PPTGSSTWVPRAATAAAWSSPKAPPRRWPDPGYAVGYAWGSGVSFDGPTPKVRVSDAEGKLLAEFP